MPDEGMSMHCQASLLHLNALNDLMIAVQSVLPDTLSADSYPTDASAASSPKPAALPYSAALSDTRGRATWCPHHAVELRPCLQR